MMDGNLIQPCWDDVRMRISEAADIVKIELCYTPSSTLRAEATYQEKKCSIASVYELSQDNNWVFPGSCGAQRARRPALCEDAASVY